MFRSRTVTNVGRFTVTERNENDQRIVVEIQDKNVDHLFARGTAKLNPSDHFDPDTGSGIAFGRALQKFGRKMENYWESLSETESQHRGRVKAERKEAEYFEVFMSLVKAQERVARLKTKPIHNAPQQPTTALEGEVKPITVTEATPKSKGAHV